MKAIFLPLLITIPLFAMEKQVLTNLSSLIEQQIKLMKEHGTSSLTTPELAQFGQAYLAQVVKQELAARGSVAELQALYPHALASALEHETKLPQSVITRIQELEVHTVFLGAQTVEPLLDDLIKLLKARTEGEVDVFDKLPFFIKKPLEHTVTKKIIEHLDELLKSEDVASNGELQKKIQKIRDTYDKK